MKATFVVSAIVSSAFVVSLTAIAQEKPPAPAAKEHTMTGCLAKGAGDSFVVNSTAEKGPKTIGIVASKDNLAPHVGHKIDITGVNVPAAEAEAMKPAPPKADHYMRLSAVKMVAAACP